MLRASIVGLLTAFSGLSGGVALGEALVVAPPKDSTALFGSYYGLGFSDGELYLHTGNSIYVLDRSGGETPSFRLYMTGLEFAFGGPRRGYEGAFAAGPGGKALVSMGFTDGGALLVDLATRTTRVVPDFDGDGSNDDNIFSATVGAEGRIYAMWASRRFFPVDATKVYAIDPVTLETRLVADVNPGEYSGGLALDSQGNLYAGTFVAGQFPNPVGTAKLFLLNAGELNGNGLARASLVGGGASNGNIWTVVDRKGSVFIGTPTGIGVLRPGSTKIRNFYGNITDEGLFSNPKFILEGLAYDPVNDRIAFLETEKGTVQYVPKVLPVPEPASLAMLIVGVICCSSRRKRVAVRGVRPGVGPGLYPEGPGVRPWVGVRT